MPFEKPEPFVLSLAGSPREDEADFDDESPPQATPAPKRAIPRPVERRAEGGRPQKIEVDTRPPAPDTKAPTEIPRVDTPAPTKKRRGRPPKLSVGAHKKDRHTKDRGRANLRPKMSILKRFKHFITDADIDMTTFFEIAGVHYIEAVGAHNKSGVDTKAPHDELMMLYKTSDDIIRLYQKYNPGNKWRAADDEIGQQFNRTDRRIIEYAIIYTLNNAGFKKVNSFKYYVDEITSLIDKQPSDETLNMMVDSARRTWQMRKEGKL